MGSGKGQDSDNTDYSSGGEANDDKVFTFKYFFKEQSIICICNEGGKQKGWSFYSLQSTQNKATSNALWS